MGNFFKDLGSAITGNIGIPGQIAKMGWILVAAASAMALAVGVGLAYNIGWGSEKVASVHLNAGDIAGIASMAPQGRVAKMGMASMAR